jgi:hypothetical protein
VESCYKFGDETLGFGAIELDFKRPIQELHQQQVPASVNVNFP